MSKNEIRGLKDRLIDAMSSYITDVMTSNKTCGAEYIHDLKCITDFSSRVLDTYKDDKIISYIDHKYSGHFFYYENESEENENG